MLCKGEHWRLLLVVALRGRQGRQGSNNSHRLISYCALDLRMREGREDNTTEVDDAGRGQL